MKISVAIAAYRGEKFIGELLASLAAQNMPPDEIVITDDSPDDLTYEAVKSFGREDIIRYFRNGECCGVNRNFEKAVSLCQGEYIFLCDQDDVWLPEKISEMVNVLEQDRDACGAFCDSSAVGADLSSLGYSLWQMRGFDRKMRENMLTGNQLPILLKRVVLSTHNIVLRRDALTKIMPLPELFPFYIDTWAALCVAADGRWAIVDKVLTLYRMHGGNVSSPGAGGIRLMAEAGRRARKNGYAERNAVIAENIIARNAAMTAENKKAMCAFIKHQRARAAYSANFFLRGIGIMREIFSLRYHRYSNGLKSAAADLFFFR